MSGHRCLTCSCEIAEDSAEIVVRARRGPIRYLHVDPEDCARALAREQYRPGGVDPEGSMRGQAFRRRR